MRLRDRLLRRAVAIASAYIVPVDQPSAEPVPTVEEPCDWQLRDELAQFRADGHTYGCQHQRCAELRRLLRGRLYG